MEQKVRDGGIALSVGVVVGNVLGHQVSQLHQVATHQTHHSKSCSHDLGHRRDVVLSIILDLNIVKLVAVAQIPKIFVIECMSFICDSDAASGEDSVVDRLDKKIVDFAPIGQIRTAEDSGNHQNH